MLEKRGYRISRNNNNAKKVGTKFKFFEMCFGVFRIYISCAKVDSLFGVLLFTKKKNRSIFTITVEWSVLSSTLYENSIYRSKP